MPNPVVNLWRSLFRKTQANPESLVGSIAPLSLGSARQLRQNLEIPETPIRAVLNNLPLTYDLLEMRLYSLEYGSALRFLSSDCFQQQQGRIASWEMAPTWSKEEVPIHPDVLAIGREIESRFDWASGTMVLGGDKLMRAPKDFLSLGNAYLELGIEREGISRNDFYIARSQFLPPLSMFCHKSERGGAIEGYSQRRSITFDPNTDRFFEPFKILDFCYQPSGVYGVPIGGAAIADQWRQLKDCSIDLEEAGRAVGISPWLHIMPPGWTDKQKQQYQQEHESLLRSGILPNLYLLNGAEVKKAAADSNALAALSDRWLKLRYACIPPGVPLWAFPGLGLESASGKDIANQPALTYGRMIADLRGLIGAQVKKAISIEIVMKKGWDFFQEHGKFDIVWQPWIATGNEDIQLHQDESGSTSSGELSNQADRLLRTADEFDVPAIDSLIGQIQQSISQCSGEMRDRLKESETRLKTAKLKLLQESRSL